MLSVKTIALGYDWVIVPGVRVGPMTKDTGESEVKTMYGESRVIASDIEIGEGEKQPGTTLFPNDSERVLYILWTDESREQIAAILIRSKGTTWKTDKGVTIGTSLEAIERVNGRPVTLAGFGWDYSGSILDSDGGALKELGIQTDRGIKDRTLILRVSPRSELQGSSEYRSVLGDRTFKSDHPAMRWLKPSVYEIIVFLR